MRIRAPTCSNNSYDDRRGFASWREGRLQDASVAAREQRKSSRSLGSRRGLDQGSGFSSPCFSCRSEGVPGEVEVAGYGGEVRRLRERPRVRSGGVLAQTRCSPAPSSRPSSPLAGVASSASPSFFLGSGHLLPRPSLPGPLLAAVGKGAKLQMAARVGAARGVGFIGGSRVGLVSGGGNLAGAISLPSLSRAWQTRSRKVRDLGPRGRRRLEQLARPHPLFLPLLGAQDGGEVGRVRCGAAWHDPGSLVSSGRVEGRRRGIAPVAPFVSDTAEAAHQSADGSAATRWAECPRVGPCGRGCVELMVSLFTLLLVMLSAYDFGFPRFSLLLAPALAAKGANMRLSSSLQDLPTFTRIDPLERGSSIGSDLSSGRAKPVRTFQRDGPVATFSKERTPPSAHKSKEMHESSWLCCCADLLGSSEYFVVLDCGSTGTRVYVYEWNINHNDPNAFPIVLKPLGNAPKKKSGKLTRLEWRTKPGLSKLVHNESGLKKAIEPLLQTAERQIPRHAHKHTPLFLYATAGVRKLPSADSEWLLDKAWDILKNSPFLCSRDRVKIITGMDEAYYGWIAALVKTGSRSQTMDAGIPWRRTISLKKARATKAAVYGCDSKMKWAYLEKRSTTVRMTVLPCTRRRASMKSMAMSVHTANGTSSGCSNPAGCRCSILLRWQVSQARTNSWTNVLGTSSSKMTYGSLDLGGSSLQVTFDTDNKSAKDETSIGLRMGSVDYQLSAYSLTGYGLNDAFDKSVAHLVKRLGAAANNGKVQVKHPCLQSGYKEDYVCSYCHSLKQDGSPSVGEKTTGKEKQGIAVEMVGAPQWNECSALAKVTVNLSEWSSSSPGLDCNIHPCALASNFPQPHGQFFAMSVFFVVFKFFNLTAEATLVDVLKRGQEFCEKPWNIAKSSVPPQPFIVQYCFRAPFIASLLREGLQIKDNQVIIGSGSITWTLGVALVEAGQALSSRNTDRHSTNPASGDKPKYSYSPVSDFDCVGHMRHTMCQQFNSKIIPQGVLLLVWDCLSDICGVPLIQNKDTSAGSLGQMQFSSGVRNPSRGPTALQSRRSQSREDLISTLADIHVPKKI
ncbi:LOW QUALITY PROTEIN: hypothetical protein U9M48_039048 [Paspalum notatum var. saurae]|uniref:Apyrase n=1 Tax=Paspalum notatum var. saurae TaxID=547442 RepID=A0AAQ3XC96_PASNO